MKEILAGLEIKKIRVEIKTRMEEINRRKRSRWPKFKTNNLVKVRGRKKREGD